MILTNQRKVFRDMIKKPGLIVAPGAHDAVSARVIEKVGFPAVWVSGFGCALSHAGLSDANLMSMSEHLTATRNIASAVNIPTIVDCDNGYGNAINVIRTVKEFEKAGSSAIVLEDQVFPKRCGLFPGLRELVSKEEMVGKIRAAKDAQEDEDFFVIARTDSFDAGLSLEKALDRAKAYADAGADGVLAISKEWKDLRAFAKSWKSGTPIFVAPTLFPEVTFKEIEELGFKASIYSVHALYAALRAMENFLTELRKQGSWEKIADKIYTFQDIVRIAGLEEVMKNEEKYLPKTTLA